MKKITFFFFFIIAQFGMAQPPTVGLLYEDTNASDAYALFTPQQNNETYLVDNCGQKIHQWSFTEFPGATCYLLANGDLLRAGKDFIETRGWHNEVIWSYGTTANGIMQHHDICPLPNGNVLCLVTDPYPLAQATALGRNPAITGANLRLEKIIELHPTGLNTATIVWEWKFKDHLIQDFDASKLNYGVVADHAELLNVNYNNNNAVDFIHTNSIDYNPALDQVMISSRHLSEIFIIDHSTTTAQAASHSGGASNHGGDFLWRWGNPQVYGQGTVADRKLFLQHDAKWVKEDYLDYGKITVFNNGDPAGTQAFSSAVMVAPEIIAGAYTKLNNKFNPAAYDWSWNGSILGITVNEAIMSGVQSLPNGNIVISESSLGRISEMTKSGTLLWSYKNPTGAISGSGVTIYPQFSNPNGNNAFFRAEKYPVDYIGFAGHDVTSANGIIEDQNSLSVTCLSALGVSHPELENIAVLNPAANTIRFTATFEVDSVTIFDINGRLVYTKNSFVGDKIDADLSPALYLMKIQKGNSIKNLKVIVGQ